MIAILDGGVITDLKLSNICVDCVFKWHVCKIRRALSVLADGRDTPPLPGRILLNKVQLEFCFRR